MEEICREWIGEERINKTWLNTAREREPSKMLFTDQATALPTLWLIQPRGLPQPRNINPLANRAIFSNETLETKQPPFEKLCSHSHVTRNPLCLFPKHCASLTSIFAHSQTCHTRNKYKPCKTTNGYHVDKLQAHTRKLHPAWLLVAGLIEYVSARGSLSKTSVDVWPWYKPLCQLEVVCSSMM